MAATFSSMLSIKPKNLIVGHRPVIGHDYSSPFIVDLPTTTRRRPVVTTNCISDHTRDVAKLRSSTEGVDILSSLFPDEPRSGVLILVEALQREGVTDIFTNKDQRIPLKALSATTINTHMFLTHCSELLAAKGYAMATGLPGVCMTSWISAGGLTYEFIRGMAYACENNIPLLVMVVDGWEKEKEKMSTKTKDYGRRLDEMIKCRFRITSAKDIPAIVREALFVARSGRPGPVLIDHISYDSVHKLDTPVWDFWDQKLICPPLLPPSSVPRPTRAQLEKVIEIVRESKRPLVCVSSGCFEWSKELTRFVELTGIPVFKDDVPVYLTDGDFKPKALFRPYESCSRFSLEHFDLLLALDARSYYDRILDLRRSDSVILQFDVTGGCEDDEEEKEAEVDDEKSFLDVQPGSVSSIGCGDMKSVLQRLNHLLEEGNVGSALDFSTWRKKIEKADNWEVYIEHDFSDYVKHVMNEIANRGDTFIFTSDKGYRVRIWDWFTRGSLVIFNFFHFENENFMDVTLPLSAGAAIGKGRRAITCGDEEEITVINISEDVEVFLENIQELVVLKRENIPVKVVIFNDILNKNKFNLDSSPDLVSAVRSLGIPSSRITEGEEVRKAMKVMMETPGPYVLEIIEPYDRISIYDMVFEEEGQEVYALRKELDSIIFSR